MSPASSDTRWPVNTFEAISASLRTSRRAVSVSTDIVVEVEPLRVEIRSDNAMQADRFGH